jgi:hypothetical protein
MDVIESLACSISVSSALIVTLNSCRFPVGFGNTLIDLAIATNLVTFERPLFPSAVDEGYRRNRTYSYGQVTLNAISTLVMATDGDITRRGADPILKHVFGRQSKDSKQPKDPVGSFAHRQVSS